VIYAAAKAGICTEGSTMICPWFACADCARAIVLAGVKQVIGHKQRMELTPDRWSGSVNHGDVILKEAGIDCIYYDGTIDGLSVLVNETLTLAI
jgi:deoxycytidylate deaminase